MNNTPEKDEQGERIRENWAEARENFDEYTFSELEDIFEDRDPLEFIW